MRGVLLAMVLLSLPAGAIAQTAPTSSPPGTATSPAPAARTPRGGDITKEDYVERARRAAERRFDRMDTNHDGILTAEERRAAREERAGGRRGSSLSDGGGAER